ncbi:MAG: hypothetical protein ACEQSX_09560 [Baekduiaceae bacterium]
MNIAACPPWEYPETAARAGGGQPAGGAHGVEHRVRLRGADDVAVVARRAEALVVGDGQRVAALQ